MTEPKKLCTVCRKLHLFKIAKDIPEKDLSKFCDIFQDYLVEVTEQDLLDVLETNPKFTGAFTKWITSNLNEDKLKKLGWVKADECKNLVEKIKSRAREIADYCGQRSGQMNMPRETGEIHGIIFCVEELKKLLEGDKK